MRLELDMHDINPKSWKRIQDSGFRDATVGFADLKRHAQAAVTIVGRADFLGGGRMPDQLITAPGE